MNYELWLSLQHTQYCRRVNCYTIRLYTSSVNEVELGRLCFVLCVCVSGCVCQQNYCRSNQLISLKLRIIYDWAYSGSGKIRLTSGDQSDPGYRFRITLPNMAE